MPNLNDPWQKVITAGQPIYTFELSKEKIDEAAKKEMERQEREARERSKRRDYILRFRQENTSFDTDFDGGVMLFEVGKLYIVNRKGLFFEQSRGLDKTWTEDHDENDLEDIHLKRGAAMMYLGYRPTEDYSMVFELYFLYEDKILREYYGGPDIFMDDYLVPHRR